ncbi:MAG: glycosyltransferase [Alphaproteobacteria bacterium]|nr:glycosyltransferase [Alphaproteobacteria bacterium]
MTGSIFKDYYVLPSFIDKFQNYDSEGVTIIIPTIHNNEMWEANLFSIYREIPVAELIIGDGGCLDGSLEKAKKLPRVTVQDHTNYNSLGYSTRKLIEAVETEWFIYLHSDVYIPSGWFENMMKHKDDYEWFGCRMRETLLVEFDSDYGDRPYAGSQIGKKEAFVNGLSRIDDDYVYRQEDFVFADIIKRGGYREGKIDDVFHYHQYIKKPSAAWNPMDVKVSINSSFSSEQLRRTWETQVKGIVKYLQPDIDWLVKDAATGIIILDEGNHISLKEMFKWIKDENPAWAGPVRKKIFKLRIKAFLISVGKRVISFLD